MLSLKEDSQITLEINKEHLKAFDRIKDLYLPKTIVPKENNWKSLSNDDIWFHIVAQVMIVGNSKPYDKFIKDENLKNQISFQTLLNIENQETIAKIINHILREVGSRYANKTLSKCMKTRALVTNFNYLKKYNDGPIGFLNYISKIDNEKQRIRYVVNNFKYVKNKGARDLLMELGLIRNSIAIDVRIQNILKKMGIEISQDSLSNPLRYEQIQKEIIEKICNPLDISRIAFDRMLYQNYEEIMNK